MGNEKLPDSLDILGEMVSCNSQQKEALSEIVNQLRTTNKTVATLNDHLNLAMVTLSFLVGVVFVLLVIR